MVTRNAPDRAFIRVIMSALVTLGSPRSLSVYMLIKAREWDQLATLVISPSDYLDTPSGVLRYHRDSQALALVTKVPWPTTINRRKAAEHSFEVAESSCCVSNYLLDWVTSGLRSDDRALNAMRDILACAKKWLTRVLGPVPDALSGRFGPGTCFELRGSAFSTLADKMVITPSCTADAEAVFRLLAEPTWWFRARLRQGLPFISRATGNRFTTVPKNGKTDRGICIEPLGNLWGQLAVGGYMKDRLKRVGLDCARSNAPSDPIEHVRRRLLGRVPLTGQDTHRDLALRGSIDGSLATIDLSGASDTVSRKLVNAILPADWAQLLNCLRSPKTLHQGRWVHLQKFSSMGCGFTFELETAIFAALARAVSRFDGFIAEPGRDIFVYGDDIIVPTKVAKSTVRCLEAFGFEVNERKSFLSGLFKESCGGDYFCGFDVRPYFIKAEPSDPLAWMVLHNELKKRGLVSNPGLLIGQVPSRLRLFGPSSLSGVFHSRDRAQWLSSNSCSIHWVRTLQPKPLKIQFDRWPSWVHLGLALVGESSQGVVPRDTVAGYRVVKASVS